MPNQRLEAVAEEISRVCPIALIVASDYLAKDAELAVRSGAGYDSQRTQDVLLQVKKILACLDAEQSVGISEVGLVG
jgi:hypothetical protein